MHLQSIVFLAYFQWWQQCLFRYEFAMIFNVFKMNFSVPFYCIIQRLSSPMNLAISSIVQYLSCNRGYIETIYWLSKHQAVSFRCLFSLFSNVFPMPLQLRASDLLTWLQISILDLLGALEILLPAIVVWLANTAANSSSVWTTAAAAAVGFTRVWLWAWATFSSFLVAPLPLWVGLQICIIMISNQSSNYDNEK